MLRHVRSSELSAGSAPEVRTLLAPEASSVTKQLAQAAQRCTALDRLRAQLNTSLTTLLEGEAHRALGFGADPLRALLDQELARLRRAESIEVRVHPEDALLLEAEPVVAARLALQGCLRFVADETLSRGGCIFESTLGEVDARIETRIEHFCALLVEGSWR